MLKVRAHVMVRGKVQGVYFRYETRDQAIALGVNGWVRNRPDGSVEAVFEGDRDKVEKLIKWCRQGPPMASVSDVQIRWEDYSDEFSSFKIEF